VLATTTPHSIAAVEVAAMHCSLAFFVLYFQSHGSGRVPKTHWSSEWHQIK